MHVATKNYYLCDVRNNINDYIGGSDISSEDLADTVKQIDEKLTNADINTIKLLYKIKPDITNSNENTGEYLPEVILGSDEEINRAKLEEAKRYIQNARRRFGN